MGFIQDFLNSNVWNQPLNSNWVLSVSLAILAIFLFIAYKQNPQNYRRKLNAKRIKTTDIEKALKKFKDAGLFLNDGIKFSDLVKNFYQNATFYSIEEFLFFAFGSEIQKNNQWLKVCDRVLYFDYESISEIEDYLEIFHNFIKLIPNIAKLNAKAEILENKFLFLIGNYKNQLEIKIDNDWADEKIIKEITTAIKDNLEDDVQLYIVESGQSDIFVVLKKSEAKTFLQELNWLTLKKV